MSAPRPMRRDAAQNLAKVLVAAERVFADRGIGATVEDVAHEAGVGVGTLYRRFAHKQELIDALVGRLRLELRDLARSALEQPDASGLEWLLAQVGAFQARQQACVTQIWDHSDAEQQCMEEFRTVVARLLEAAQAAKRIRADATTTDITHAFWSIRGVIEQTRDDDPPAWQRHTRLVLAGLRPPGSRRFPADLSAQLPADGDARS